MAPQPRFCVPCRSGEPLASATETAELMTRLPDWSIIEKKGVKQLQHSYPFKNFRQALDYTNRVGELAEQEQHHPAILTEWGRVTLRWWTHALGGLHRNDFLMAEQSDRLYRGEENG